PALREKVHAGGVSAAKLARSWAVLSGSLFADPNLTVSKTPGDLLISAPQDELTLLCRVDRRTLVPRRYMLQDASGRVRFTLDLDDYRMIQGIPFPHRLRAQSDDGGRIVLELRDVELNGELAPGAFVPPRRAERIAPWSADR